MDNDRFRPVNRTLGAQPRIGPFALYQIAPFFLSLLFTYLLQGLLGFDWILGALIICALTGGSLVLLGKQPWRFFAQITDCPQVVRAGCYYQPLGYGKNLSQSNSGNQYNAHQTD